MKALIAAIANNQSIAVAIIAALGVTLSALISYYISSRSNYINTVTAARINWIGNVRSNIANLYAQIEYIDYNITINDDYSASDEYAEKMKELVRIITLIKLQLNPFNKIEKNIIAILDELTDPMSSHPYESPKLQCDNLISHGQWLFKTEWEKIKIETAGFWRKPWLRLKVHCLMHRYDEFEHANER